MAVTDGVFDEGTFDNATFNNLTRGESVNLADTVSLEADLKRFLQDNLTVSDADIKQLEKVLSESLTSNDNVDIAVILLRIIQESVSLNDTSLTQADLFRTVSESLDLNDFERYSLARVLSSSVTLSDSVRRNADLFRTVQAVLNVQDSPSGTVVESGRFLTPATNTTKTVDVGFEPDAVEFKATSTNPSFDTEGNTNGGVQINGGDFGWSHGFASFEGVIEQVASGHGSGSASTNGHYSENSDSLCILQPITDDSGDNLEGYVQASMQSRDSTSFTLNFTATHEQQYVTYTAYKFSDGEHHVGFFDSPTGTSTVSVTEPGFKPNFARVVTTPNLGDMNINVNYLGNGNNTVGWSQGVAVENSVEGLSQGSLGVSQWPSNIDGHSYNASDTDVISLAYMDSSKQSLAGTIEADITSFTSNGFDINYSVNNPTATGGDDYPVVTYLVADTNSQPTAGFETTPTGTGVQSYSTPFEVQSLNFIASNTNPDFQSEGGLGRKTWGWMYGEFVQDGNGFRQAMGWSSNSDSVNGHAYGSSDTDSYYMLFTDNNGSIYGKDVGRVQNVNSSGFEIDWTEITTSADSGYLNFDTSAFIYYGFQVERDSGVKIRLDKKVSEALGLNDFVVSQAELFRALTSFVELNDADVKQLERLLSETVLTDDRVESSAVLSRQFFENVSLSEQVFKALLKDLQESIVLNDDVDKSILLAFSENVSTVDDVNTDSELFRSLNESVTVDDGVRAIIIVRDVLTESLSVQDNVDSTADLDRLLDESVNVLDDVETVAELFRTLQESIGLQEESFKSLFRVLTEQVGVNDKDVEFLLKTILSEQIGLADDVDVTAEFFRVLNEFLLVQDADLKDLSRRLDENVLTDDNVSLEKTQFRDFAESIVLSDESRKKMFRVLAETVLLVDEVQSEASLFRDLKEFAGVQDELSKTFSAVLTDKVVLNDFLQDSTTYARSLQELVNISDFVVLKTAFVSRQLSESLTLTDSVVTETGYERNLDEEVQLNSFVFTAKTFFREFNEVLEVGDDTVKKVSKVLQDGVVVDDTLEALRLAGKLAATVEINKLHKAQASLNAGHKALVETVKSHVADAELEAKEKSEVETETESVSDGDLDKF